MSDIFSQISANRRRLSESDALTGLNSGDWQQAEVLLNRKRASRELIEAVAERLVEERPERFVSKLIKNPFDPYLIADPVTGKIHRSESSVDGELIIEARPSCSDKTSTYQRLLPIRAEHPLPHQHLCRDCSIEVGDDDLWSKQRQRDLVASIEQALGEERMILLGQLASDSYQQSELDYQINQIIKEGRQVIEGLLSEEDYLYFQERLGRKPETLISSDDWRRLIETERRPLSLAVDISLLLKEKSNA